MIMQLIGAYEHDPLVVISALFGVLIVLGGILFRKGGAEPGFIIDVFAYLATIGTALKVFLGVLSQLNGGTSAKLEGTDLLLLLGAFIAVIAVSIQGLYVSIDGKEGKQRLIGQVWLNLQGKMPEKILKLFGARTIEDIKETQNGDDTKSVDSSNSEAE